MTSLPKNQLILLAGSAAYIIGFAAYYLFERNYEFLWYVLVLVSFFILIVATLRRSHFDSLILWGLSLWGLLHMAGGGVLVNGEVLYRLHIVPIVGSGDAFVLRFDQFVHFFGFAVATLVVHHLLKPYLNETTNWKVVYPLIVAAGAGLGALNEVVEFTAVVLIDETGVGGYYNTAIDLVFNTLGAVAAVFLIHFRRKHEAAAGAQR